MEDGYRNLPNVMPVWLEKTQQLIVTGTHEVSCAPCHSCVLEVFIGHCLVNYQQHTLTLGARSILYLSRGESVQLQKQGDSPCRLIIVWIGNAERKPYIDLRALCVKLPTVNDFYMQKNPMCLMVDKAQVYLSIGDIQNEYLNRRADSDDLLYPMLEILYLRLARCIRQPNRSTGVNYLIKAKAYIDENLQRTMTIGEIAAYTGISKSYLESLFRSYLDKSVVEYIQMIRCQNAADLLATTTFPIIEVAIDSGFNNRQHFSRVFSDQYGMTPGQYRKIHQQSILKE